MQEQRETEEELAIFMNQRLVKEVTTTLTQTLEGKICRKNVEPQPAVTVPYPFAVALSQQVYSNPVGTSHR